MSVMFSPNSAFFGLNDTNWNTIYEQRIIDRASASRKLPNGDAKRSRQILGLDVLNRPARLLQLFVNDKPRFIFVFHDAYYTIF